MIEWIRSWFCEHKWRRVSHGSLRLPFPSDVEVPTCSSCGAWFVSEKIRNEVKQHLKVKHNL